MAQGGPSVKTAALRLGQRSSHALTDVQSLQSELNSLRHYRDTLHDTMKGLVEKAKGKLEDGDELATNLEKVAAALGMLTEQKKVHVTENGGPSPPRRDAPRAPSTRD